MYKNEFIERAKEKFGDKFDYSQLPDKFNLSDSITIVCPKHGEFITKGNAHLYSKFGCRKCATESSHSKSKKTTEQFIKEAKTLYGDNRYSYEKTIYINADTKVTVTCPVHGDFQTRPADFIRGHGCPKCKGIKTKEFNITTKRYTKEQFIEKGKLLYNNLFSYEQCEYINSRIKVLLHSNLCNEDFLITPSHFLVGDIPKKYLGIEYKDVNINTEIFIQRSKLIFGDTFTYNNSKCINTKSPICVTCKTHGDFYTNWADHLYHQCGCPKCNQSKGERIISEFLDLNSISYIPQYPLKIGNKLLKVDFCIMYDGKIIYIEYNGIQHYKPVEFFGGEEKFRKQVERDNNLRQYCKENNIRLLEYSYQIKLQDLTVCIKKDLQEH